MRHLLKWLNPSRLRVGVILGPWVVGLLFLYFLAADRYVSESVLVVRSGSESPNIVGGLATLFPAVGNSARTDSMTLVSYIQSGDILAALDSRLHLREAYSAPLTDVVFRLSKNASREQFVDYFRDRVEALVDDDSQLITLRTQAFSPELSAALNKAIIDFSEQFINETSHRIAREQMAFAQSELNNAQTALEAAQRELQSFQDKHGVLDPSAQAQANTGVTVGLQAALSRQEADLKGMLGYLDETAPQVRTQRQQIEGTKAQLDVEGRRGTARGAQLNVLAGDYQMLALRFQFAQDVYRAANSAVEGARTDSVRKLKTLVLIESPATPQRADLPRRAYGSLALLLGLCLVYGIIRLAVATIEDHQI